MQGALKNKDVNQRILRKENEEEPLKYNLWMHLAPINIYNIYLYMSHYRIAGDPVSCVW